MPVREISGRTQRQHALTASLLGLLVAMPASAQSVSGTVRTSTGTPTAGTAVILTDSAGRIVVGASTDDEGWYVVRAPSAGHYRLRARRIGFAPDSSPVLVLDGGGSTRYDPVLTPFATQLSAVRVDAARRCEVAPANGALAHRLWDDVQSALTAELVAAGRPEHGFLLRRFQRVLDPTSRVERSSATWDARAVSSEPYASISADSLAAHGFVVPHGDMLTYYAPDARTLLADGFARGHCFRAVDDPAHPGDVGLAFAPANTSTEGATPRGAGDIAGTLWLDRTSGALRDLEYVYSTVAPRRPVDHGLDATPRASGRVTYGQLGDGTWIVQDWVIRMPVLSTETIMAPTGLSSTVAPDASMERTQRTRVVAIWEAGGQVLRSFAAADSVANGPVAYARLRGRFVDTTTGGDRGASSSSPHGIPGIRVTVRPAERGVSDAGVSRGAERIAVTDRTGTFVLDSLPPGAYVISATAGPLDTLGVVVPARTLALDAGVEQSLLTVIPPRGAAARGLCGRPLGTAEQAVHGVVVDGDGRPVPRARVTVRWFDVPDARTAHFVAHTETRATVADPAGEYVVCDVPRGAALSVDAVLGTAHSDPVSLPQDAASDVRLAHLTLPGGRARDDARPRGRSAGVARPDAARIVGTVVDSTGHAITQATVRVDSTAWISVGPTGFVLGPLAPGAHVFEVRALGYAPRAWRVTVHPDRPVGGQFVLDTRVRLADVTVVAPPDTADARGSFSEFERRRRSNSGGSYLDEAQIAARGATRLTDLLRSLPGVALAPTSNQYGGRDEVLVMRGVATAGGERCPIQYFLDGLPFDQSDDIDRLVSPKEVAAIEVYPGASQVPGRFKGPTARCGVIAIWTHLDQHGH